MAYFGTYDLSTLAQEIATTFINGNITDALATISILNPLQTLYLLNELREHLSPEDIERFTRTAQTKMNDDSWFESVQKLGQILAERE